MNVMRLAMLGGVLGMRIDEHEMLEHEDHQKARDQRRSQVRAERGRAVGNHLEEGGAEQHSAREADRQDQAAIRPLADQRRKPADEFGRGDGQEIGEELQGHFSRQADRAWLTYARPRHNLAPHTSRVGPSVHLPHASWP